MFRSFCLFFLLLVAASVVDAQQRPMSPPSRPPIPLSDADQERARLEALAKEKEALAKERAEATTDKTPSGIQVKIPAALVGRHISSGNSSLDALVYDAAGRYGLDPCLILSVMRAESGFNRTAVSIKGASGLMQLMPETASRFGVKNIFDPQENIFGGARYLRWLLDRFRGDVRLALAGYNAGEGAVELYGSKIPPFLETQNYVRTIYARYSGIHTGLPSPPVTAPVTASTVVDSKEKIPTYNQIIKLTSSSGDESGR